MMLYCTRKRTITVHKHYKILIGSKRLKKLAMLSRSSALWHKTVGHASFPVKYISEKIMSFDCEVLDNRSLLFET